MLETMYTPSEIAESLKLSLSTVRRAIGAGHLACSRIGAKGQIRVSQGALDAWIDARSLPNEKEVSVTADLRQDDIEVNGRLRNALSSVRTGRLQDGHSWRIISADVRIGLRLVEPKSIACIVTSPPYFWQRDYEVKGQIGQESTIQGYVDELVDSFRAARHVLADDGLLFLNLGDGFYNAKGRPHGSDPKHAARMMARRVLRAVDGPGLGLPRKSLIGVPWRVALALQADGWTLRSAIVWNRPGNLGEPTAKDRPHRTHEYVFMFSKKPKYYFDRAALNGDGDVWTIRARPENPYAHCAPFPAELVEKCLACGCRAGGRVLDPFMGSGTTLLAALKSGRSAIGIELNDDFSKAADNRIRETFAARVV